MIRFWRPEREGQPDEWSLVACVASSQCLWVIAAGPSLPIPKEPWSEHFQPEMLMMDAVLSSGVKLRFVGASCDSGKGGQQYLGQFEVPPEPSEPLTVRMTKEDGTGRDQWIPLWEAQAYPVE